MIPGGDAGRFAGFLFTVYDEDGNGEVDFQEFLHALHITQKGDKKVKFGLGQNLLVPWSGRRGTNTFFSREIKGAKIFLLQHFVNLNISCQKKRGSLISPLDVREWGSGGINYLMLEIHFA